jgi:murein DD-endopeptidase MepM/ murein hydrolase activator NlpD
MPSLKYNILGEDYCPIAQLPLQYAQYEGGLIPIDLSTNNEALVRSEAMDLDKLSAYVTKHIKKGNAKGAWGGYAEKRDLYRRSSVFAESKNYRNIHLGIDFWLPAGTEVLAPLSGEVHSFADNDESGNYGPTIVLLHQVGNLNFHSLYGHLSRTSLEGLKVGQIVRRGQVIATLGTPDENKDWPPHLHFQIIKDMEGMEGDYPGVCFEKEKAKYLANCPDPASFLSWPL